MYKIIVYNILYIFNSLDKYWYPRLYDITLQVYLITEMSIYVV